MAASPEPMSPTDAASPLGGSNREEGANGFTAVNGQNSPSQGPKTIRVSEEIKTKPQHQDESRRGASNEERSTKANGADIQRNGSPLSSTAKRKRSVEQDDYDSPGESDDEDSLRPANSNYRSATAEEWNGRDAGEEQMESRLVAELQRDRQQTSNGHAGAINSDSPTYGGGPRAHQQDEYITTPAGVQMDPKKRKRAFTNRTKTGCQTCRRRKKKCDEAKPECHNCTRGGFLCEGYQAKSPWPKNSTPKQGPIPLQARGDPYGDSGNLYPRPAPGDSPGQPHSRRARPGTLDDEDRPMGNQWAHSPYGDVPSRPYGQGREPTHGLPMQSHSLQMRDYDRSMPSVMHPGLSSLHGHGIHGSPSIVGLAQSALRNQQPQVQNPNYSGARKTEKQKMLTGELYKPYDNQLQDERAKCTSGLYSFNNNRDVSQQERVRQLRKIFEDQAAASHNGQQSVGIQHIGKGVFVDPPFRCDYGYNIIIGADVAIESGCFISDPCLVKIGANTMIGPDVHIMGKKYPIEPNMRNGALHGKARGYRITIGEGVNLGCGVIIDPDEKWCENGELVIGEGSYIPAGTVVTRNVPPFTLYGQKPSDQPDVLRGLYASSEQKGRV